MKKRKLSPTLVYIVVMFLLMSWASKLFAPEVEAVPYSKIVGMFRSEQVKSFTVKDETISLKLHNGTTVNAALADPTGVGIDKSVFNLVKSALSKSPSLSASI